MSDSETENKRISVSDLAKQFEGVGPIQVKEPGQKIEIKHQQDSDEEEDANNSLPVITSETIGSPDVPESDESAVLSERDNEIEIEVADQKTLKTEDDDNENEMKEMEEKSGRSQQRFSDSEEKSDDIEDDEDDEEERAEEQETSHQNTAVDDNNDTENDDVVKEDEQENSHQNVIKDDDNDDSNEDDETDEEEEDEDDIDVREKKQKNLPNVNIDDDDDSSDDDVEEKDDENTDDDDDDEDEGIDADVREEEEENIHQKLNIVTGSDVDYDEDDSDAKSDTFDQEADDDDDDDDDDDSNYNADNDKNDDEKDDEDISDEEEDEERNLEKMDVAKEELTGGSPLTPPRFSGEVTKTTSEGDHSESDSETEEFVDAEENPSHVVHTATSNTTGIGTVYQNYPLRRFLPKDRKDYMLEAGDRGTVYENVDKAEMQDTNMEGTLYENVGKTDMSGTVPENVHKTDLVKAVHENAQEAQESSQQLSDSDGDSSGSDSAPEIWVPPSLTLDSASVTKQRGEPETHAGTETVNFPSHHSNKQSPDTGQTNQSSGAMSKVSKGQVPDWTVYENVKATNLQEVPPPVPERTYKDLPGKGGPPLPKKSYRPLSGTERPSPVSEMGPPPVPQKSFKKPGGVPKPVKDKDVPPVPERSYRFGPSKHPTPSLSDRNTTASRDVDQSLPSYSESFLYGSDEYHSPVSSLSSAQGFSDPVKQREDNFQSLPADINKDGRQGRGTPMGSTGPGSGGAGDYQSRNIPMGNWHQGQSQQMNMGNFPLQQQFMEFMQHMAATQGMSMDPQQMHQYFQQMSMSSGQGRPNVPATEKETSRAAGADLKEKSTNDTKGAGKAGQRAAKKPKAKEGKEASHEGATGPIKKTAKTTDKKKPKVSKDKTSETDGAKAAKHMPSAKEGDKGGAKKEKKKKSTKKAEPPPEEMDTYVCVSNLDPSLQLSTLRDYLEGRTTQEVDCSNVVYNEDRTVAVVPFMGTVDIEALKEQCKKKKVGGQFPEVNEVDFVKHIILSCDKEMPEDKAVREHFRKIAGNVKQYKERDDGCYLMKFESLRAVKEVCSRPAHRVGDVKLKVTPFYFTDSGEIWDKTQHKVPLPGSVIFDDIHSDLQQFLQRNNDLEVKINNELESVHAKVTLTDEITIECLLDHEYHKVRQLINQWDANAKQKLKEFVDENLKRVILAAEDNVWTDLVKVVQDTEINHSEIMIFQRQENLELVFVGEMACVDDMYNQILSHKSRIEADIKRKSQITTQNRHYQIPELRILQKMRIFDKVNKIRDDLQVTMDTDNAEVQLKGVPEDINQAIAEIAEALNQIEKWKISANALTVQQVSLLKTAKVQELLCQSFIDSDLLVEMETQGDGIQVFVLNEDNRSAVNQIIYDMTSTKAITLDETALGLLQSEEWKKLLQTIKTQKGELVDVEITNDAKVILTAISDILGEIEQLILDFVEEHSIYDDMVDVNDEGVMKFITKYSVNNFEVLQDNLRKHSLTIDIQTNQIHLAATKQGLKEAKRDVEELVQNIEHKGHKIEKLGIQNVIDPQSDFHEIEDQTTTVILLTDPGTSDQSSYGATTDTYASRKKLTDFSTRKGPRQDEPAASPMKSESTLSKTMSAPPKVGPYRCANGTQITLIKGELAKQKGDVIVCSTAKDLNLASGASGKNLLTVGGQALMDDVKAKYPTGVDIGEVATIKGGNLACKEVYLGCLPEWKKDASKNPKTIYTFMEECLTNADQSGHKIVIFPALGTGQLHYPREEAAKIMYQCVIDFDRSQGGSTIQEVQFVCYFKDTDTIKAFEGEEFKRLNPGMPLENLSPAVGRGSVKTKEGLKMTIVKGEIGKHKADVLVCAVNKDLQLKKSGGAGISLYEKGGDQLQAECTTKYPNGISNFGEFVSIPGTNTGCKEVYLTSLPDDEKEKQTNLCKFVKKCMKQADQSGHQSIAFVALGTGKIGYPRHLVARNMYHEVKEYSKSHSRCSVKDVRFVLYPKDYDTIAAFEREQSKRLGATIRGYTGTVKMPNCNISVVVESSSITKQKVDVIVVTSKPNLDLNFGQLLKSILEEGGKSIQDDCSNKFPSGIKEGDVAVLSAGNLPCRQIYIGTLPMYNQDSAAAEMSLKTFAGTCLEMANTKGYKSIAFPCIGTGYCGYQHSKSAAILFEAVKEFDKKHSSSNLKSVHFVATKLDQRSLAAFQNEEYSYSMSLPDQSMAAAAAASTSSASSSSASSALWRTTESIMGTLRRTFKSSSPPPKSVKRKQEATQNEVSVQNIAISVVKGDITEEKVDAIVNSTNEDLDFSMGGVSKVLKSKCDQSQLDKECKAKLAEMKSNHIAVTSSCGITNFKHIIHVVNQDSLSEWRKKIKACLDEAEKLHCTHVAFPVVGTGGGITKFTPENIAQTFRQAVSDFAANQQNPKVTKVKIVAFQGDMVTPLLDGLGNTQQPGIMQSAKDLMSKVGLVPRAGIAEQQKTIVNSSVLAIQIYGQSVYNIDKAIQVLEDKVTKKYTKTNTRDTLIARLEKEELDELTKDLEEYDIEFNIDNQTSSITFEGAVKEVTEAKDAVHRKLNHFQHERFLDNEAEHFYSMVHWSVMVNDQGVVKLEEYPPRQNMDLENASKRNEVQLTFKTTDGDVIVDIQNMKEYAANDPSNKSDVVRREVMKGEVAEFPANWSPVTASENIKVVNISQTDQEYIAIEKKFKDSVLQGIYNTKPPTAAHTIGQFNNVKVHKIERIQNPSLYRQYAVKKDRMSNDLPGTSIEQSLWHGAPPTAIVSINYYGFNRSYCGNNAGKPWFGDGVYFANDASYSARDWVSGKDSAGKKHMYLVKVLTGKYVQGKQGMRVLPDRVHGTPYDSAVDNPSSPMEFVIFNDTQAYPEYCIQFTI